MYVSSSGLGKYRSCLISWTVICRGDDKKERGPRCRSTNTPASRDVIGSPANRRSQRGDLCLQLQAITRLFACRRVCTRFPLHADSFLITSILSFSLCAWRRRVAWLFFCGGRQGCDVRICMQAGESEGAARLASDLFTHGDSLGDGGGGFPRGHVEGAWEQ